MYPTRERAETIRDCNAQCKRCALHNTPDTQHCVFVTDKTDTMNLNEQIGISYLTFHDALDAKQAELDKARDLIRDIVTWANSGSHPEEAVEIYRLIEKAEAMTKGATDVQTGL